MVFVEGTNITVDRPMTKLSDKRYGPYKILEKVGKSAYKLKLEPRFKRLHNVFNECLLRPCIPPAFPSQRKPEPVQPPDSDEEGDEEDRQYEVQQILEAAVNDDGELEYLVKWKNFGAEENSWEPASALTGAGACVRQFYKKNPGAPRPITELAKKMRLRLLTYDTAFERLPPRRIW